MESKQQANPTVSSSNGNRKSCHQCHRFKPNSVSIRCTNERNKGKMCPLVYCEGCLSNRYKQEVKELSGLDKWIRPRCQGNCDCSVCKKRKDRDVVVHVNAKRQATGMAVVSETQIHLIPEAAIGQKEQELTNVVGIESGATAESSNGNKKSCHQCRRRRIKPVSIRCTNEITGKACPFVYCGNCLKNRYDKQVTEISSVDKWICPRCEGNCNCTVCKKRKDRDIVGHVEIMPKDAIEQDQITKEGNE